MSIPNILTISRILAALFLPFSSSTLFLPLYIFAGVTDIIDGWIARKMNWTSKLGTFLDSIADLIFFAAVALRILLTVPLPAFILWGILLIAAGRCVTYLIGYLRFHQFASLHTYLNKFTGLLLFLTPLGLLFFSIDSIGFLLIIVGSLSAIEEFFIVLTCSKLDKNITTFFKQI